MSENKTLVIGGREIAIGIGALAITSALIAVIILIFGQPEQAPEVAVVPTSTSYPTAVVPAANTVLAPQPTLVLAPTLAPTVAPVEHIVQEGESLISIATLYNVELPALLEANTLTETSVIVPGQTLIIPVSAGSEGTYHEVQEGEVLALIAAQYGVTVEQIQQANALTDANSVYVGQRLYIPNASTPAPTSAVPTQTLPPTATSAVVAELEQSGPLKSDWPRSIIETSDALLRENYPLTQEEERFTIHYQPDTYAAANLPEIIAFIQNGLAKAEDELDVTLHGRFEIYVAGTLFEEPNASLRGMSQSRERRIFILHDGSGTPVDNAYFFTHEITHLVAWNTWGQPTTAMVSEGLATWVGRSVLEEGGYLTYDQMCEAIYAMGRMPSMAALNNDFQAFNGHIRDPFNYFGSACFVGYLTKSYGRGAMSIAYHTGEFEEVFGVSLSRLNQDWHGSLENGKVRLTLDFGAFESRMSRVSNAYDYVFESYDGSSNLHLAYAAVDRARVALWRGEFDEVDRWLREFTSFTGYTPN